MRPVRAASPVSLRPEGLERRVLLSLEPTGAVFEFDPQEFHTEWPRTAMDADGDFVAAWDVYVPGGGGGGNSDLGWVEVQRYDELGNPQGPVILPDDRPLPYRNPGAPGVDDNLNAAHPAIATDAAGNFIVAWFALDGSEHSIRARRFDADGNAVGPSFRVDPSNSDFTGDYLSVAVAMNSGGEFAVAWLDEPQGVLLRRYDAAGNPLGDPVVADGPTAAVRANVVVAMDDSGRSAVAWGQSALNSGPQSVYVRHFLPDGQPAGPRQLVAGGVPSAFGPTAVHVAMDADGDTLVSWSNATAALWTRRYSAAGEVRGDAIELAQAPAGMTISGDVAMEADGEFVAAWAAVNQNTNEARVSYRQFDSAGAPTGDAVELFRRADSRPTVFGSNVVVDDDGSHALVTWMIAVEQAESLGYGAAQRLAAPTGGVDENRPPTPLGIADVSVELGAAGSTVALPASFADDHDAAGALAYSVAANTNPGLFSSVAIDPASGVLALTYAPGATGAATLTITATDSGGLPTSATLNVTVRPNSPAPGDGGIAPHLRGDKSVVGRLVGRAKRRRPAGIEGAQVFLDANANGILDAGEPVATTAAGGIYAFTGVAAGRYRVRVTAPDGWAAAGRNGTGGSRLLVLRARQRKPAKVKPLALAPAPVAQVTPPT